jgi:FtsH-binding integral membrane protein
MNTNQPFFHANPAVIASNASYDAGLRAYMLSIYNYMAVGLGLTGLVAYIAVATGLYQRMPARR